MSLLPFVLAAASSEEYDPIEHIVDKHWGGVFDALGITKQVLFMLIAAAICLIIFPLITRRIQARGTGGRLGHFFEVILLFIRDDMVRPFMGEEGDRYLPIIWTFFFFILFCNLLGLIPEAITATGNINITAGLAVVSFVIYHSIGIQRNGLFKYLKGTFLIGPPYLWPMMILLELVSHIIRPCALAIRLFANMVAGHTMLAVLFGFTLYFSTQHLLAGGGVTLVSVGGAIFIMFLEILVAFIQAYIFAFLTAVFLALAVHPEH